MASTPDDGDPPRESNRDGAGTPPDAAAARVRQWRRRYTLAMVPVLAALAGVGYLMSGSRGALMLPAVILSPAIVLIGLASLGQSARSRTMRRQSLDAVSNAVVAEEWATATAALDELEKSERSVPVRRRVLFHRAEVLFHQSDLAAAEGCLDEALGLRPHGSIEDRRARADAVALRAVVRAARGELERSAADVAAFASMSDATPVARARNALAQMLALGRRADRPALVAHMQQNIDRLLSLPHGRERGIVRAYRRMLVGHADAPYRAGARGGIDAARPETEAWFDVVAPEAARFADERAAQPGSESLGATAAASDRAAVDAGRVRVRGRQWKPTHQFLAMTLGMVACFAAISRLFDGSAQAMVAAGLGALVAALLGGRALVARLATRRVRSLAEGFVAGREDDAERGFAALSRLPIGSVRVSSRLWLAHAAIQRAEPEAALAHLDVALAASAAGTEPAEVVLMRATALAFCGRAGEANAELERVPLLHEDHRRFVRAAAFAVAGNIVFAARVARSIDRRHIQGRRNNLFLDAVLVAEDPRAGGGVDRDVLRSDLAASAAHRRWLETLVPDVFRRIEASDGVRVASEAHIGTDAHQREGMDDGERDSLAASDDLDERKPEARLQRRTVEK